MSDDMRSLLELKGVKIILEAGYGGILSTSKHLEVLFKGDIARVSTELKGSDIVTTIEVGDGLNSYQDARVDKSYAPGTSVGSIIDDLKASMGLGAGSSEGVKNEQFANGASISGLARDHLDDLTSKQGLEWSIQDEAVQILPINGATKESVIVLSSDDGDDHQNTGLIGSPHRMIGGKDRSNPVKKDGIKFSSLLNPGLKPGRRVKIDSKFIDGVFIVRKVSHEGDTFGGDWKSECEALGG